MPEFPPFTASGEMQVGANASACDVTVDASGLTVRPSSGAAIHWPGHEIAAVEREGYELRLTRALQRGSLSLRRFARRTDELVLALRRCRADALVRLMAPPDRTPQEVTEATGGRPGFLYRYEDGLRWVADHGECFARLYGELDAVGFDPGRYELALGGPFGRTQVAGLRRLTREIEDEAAARIAQARQTFAQALEGAGLSWGELAADGRIRQHVPFVPSQEQLAQMEGSEGLICAEREAYWAALRAAGAIHRVVVSADAAGMMRVAALCPLPDGELYELLTEADHASFVFARADDAVRAWTEVGFRREPIFVDEGADEYRVLAEVLASLSAARQGLRRRVIHGEPDNWWVRLQH
ncbi:MAG: hypothetical protein AB7Y46_03575 [Armatimonadota bacterium]